MDWIRGNKKGPLGTSTYVLVAALVLAILGIRSMDEKGKAARARAKAAASSPAPAGAVALANRDRDALQADVAVGWGRDPFSRTFSDPGAEVSAGRTPEEARPAPSGGTMFLQGVMVGATGRTALINGEVCREGDRVGPYEVLSIGKRSVMLMQNGSVTTLTLKGDGS